MNKMTPEQKIEMVELWNLRCGKVSNLTGEELNDALYNQFDRIKEEFSEELMTAMSNKDQTEILDAIVDTDVVLAGLCMIGNLFNKSDYISKSTMTDFITIKDSSHTDINASLYWDLMYHYSNILNKAFSVLEESILNEEDISVISSHAMTAYAMLQTLEDFCGHDVDGAFTAIMDNNDHKWVTDATEIENELVDLLSKDTQNDVAQDYEVVTSLIEDDGDVNGTYFSIHRKDDDKICKFANHPKVDLSMYMCKLEKTFQFSNVVTPV